MHFSITFSYAYQYNIRFYQIYLFDHIMIYHDLSWFIMIYIRKSVFQLTWFDIADVTFCRFLLIIRLWNRLRNRLAASFRLLSYVPPFFSISGWISWRKLKCSFPDVSWYFLIFLDKSWYITMYHDLSWFITIYHDISWFTAVLGEVNDKCHCHANFCPIKHLIVYRAQHAAWSWPV